MKILHVIPSVSQSSGGPGAAISFMSRAQTALGLEVTVAATDDDGREQHLAVPLGQAIEINGATHYYFRKQTEFYKVSIPMRRWLNRHVRDYDLVHIHALFSFVSVAAARCARRQGVPYLIRPLGVLNRWGREHRRRWLKALSFRFVERPVLDHAAAIHYTSRSEQVEAEEAGVRTRAAVIPLGIDLAPFEKLPGPDQFLARWPQANGREIVLFLSRLNPKKGLDLLLSAFTELKRQRPQALLVLAGSGADDYIRSLQKQTEQLGLTGEIIWTGFLAGEEKLSALAAAKIFVLPSHSENFGVAVVEALAAGLPCVVAEGVAVSEDIREQDAGLVIKAEVRALAEAMGRLLKDADLRERFGVNAKKLAKERFSSQAMGAALGKLYQELSQRHRQQ